MKRTIYQAKIWIWVVVLLIGLVWSELIPFIMSGFKDPEMIHYTVLTESYSDISSFENLSDTTILDYRFKHTQNLDTADIIFTDKELNLEGYTEYKDFIYTPLVLYVSSSVKNNKSRFFINTGNSGSETSAIQCNLGDILDAMENKMTWEDIGVDSSVIKGEVVLTIPNTTSPYYKLVEELFYTTLNDLKPLTVEDRERLQPQVERLLSICNKVTNISQEAKSDYEHNNSKATKVMIGPECYYERTNLSCFGTSYGGQYRPVYLLSTKAVYLNAYVRNSGIIDSDTFTHESLVKLFRESDKFNSVVGFRVSGREYPMSSIRSFYLNDIVLTR